MICVIDAHEARPVWVGFIELFEDEVECSGGQETLPERVFDEE
jgi:hypothetical protein